MKSPKQEKHKQINILLWTNLCSYKIYVLNS